VEVLVYTVMVFATAAKFKIGPVWAFIAYGMAFQLVRFISVRCVLGIIQRRQG
jgi:hypothetical protein